MLPLPRYVPPGWRAEARQGRSPTPEGLTGRARRPGLGTSGRRFCSRCGEDHCVRRDTRRFRGAGARLPPSLFLFFLYLNYQRNSGGGSGRDPLSGLVANLRLVTDYRSERMASPEGLGNARRTFEEVTSELTASARSPLLRPIARRFAGPLAMDIAGFWLLWHLEGGFEGLLRLGMSRASIYRRIKEFRSTMGMHPDEYEMPGVTLDLEAYLTTPGPPKPKYKRPPKSQV